MNEEHKARCRLVKDSVNKFLPTLSPLAIKGAINWGDLSCRCVERVESFYDDSEDGVDVEWRVCIEEAAPGVTELHDAVSKHLATIGHVYMVVVTEW